jgi:hypothetical protein
VATPHPSGKTPPVTLSPAVPNPILLPAPGEPGSHTNPIPPVEESAEGAQPFYIVAPGYGVVGPIYLPPRTLAVPLEPPQRPVVAGEEESVP